MSDAVTDEHLGQALLRHSSAGDFTAWRDLFTSDGVIWHNTDLTNKPVDEVAQALVPVRKRATSWIYTVHRLEDFPGGFFMQFELDVTMSGGAPVKLAASLACETAGGQITKLEEYVDSAAFSVLFADPE